MKKTIFVIGAGRGCGNSVAEKFGREDFRVVLISRSEEHLSEYAADFAAKGIEVYTKAADAADFAGMTRVMTDLKEKFGVPDVLFYNVGVTLADADLSGPKDASLLLDRFRIDVAGAYNALQQVLGEEFSQKQGAFLVTGGGLSLYPMYAYLPLSMDKAALRAMCLALHEELKKQQIFVGTVTVTGLIAPGQPCDPAILAEDFWQLYSKRQECEIVR